MATFGSTPQPFTSGLTVLDDAEKGRCFSAVSAYKVGDLIYEEEALVFAHYEEHGRYEKRTKDLFVKAFSKSVLNKLEDIVDELSHLDSVQSLDTGRNFLQLLALLLLRQNNEIRSLSDFAGVTDEAQLTLKLHLLDLLTAANISSCVADIKQFRKAYPKVIPKTISHDTAGKLIGILNTNQLELEEYGGSGLFVATAIAEHSCDANCSFTTSGSKLYLAAIRDIAPGDRITIDYGNNFYSPTPDRIASLHESYEFICSCPLCTGPDRKRSFLCPACGDAGLFHPMGTGAPLKEGTQMGDGEEELGQEDFSIEVCKAYRWTPCSKCGSEMTLSYAERCLEREWHYKGNPPKSLEDIRRITQEERVLHESHYLLFWALDEIALSLAERARRLSTLNRSGLTDASRGPFQEALDAMTSTVRLLENMLPAVHHEKSVYYDRLGQLAVAAGNVELAGQSYARAYEMSKLACGAEVPNTLKLLKIAEKVPQNVEELLEHYADHSKDMEVEEDDDWIDG